MTKIGRREALKMMGAGVTGIATASVLSPLAKAKERVEYAEIEEGFARAELPISAPKPDEEFYTEPVVYESDEVVFRQLDAHTWHGHGFLCYNESIYVLEGNDSALVIDAGTKIANLDKIIAGFTSKPQILVATHVHPDHTGSAINDYPEIWINPGDAGSVATQMRNYPGKVRYLSDGQVFDLGGRQIEVIFTPGHTPGSTTFFDKERHVGFSGDAFGTTNLLLSTNFSTLMATAYRTAWYMKKHDIPKLYPGHYHGNDCETLARVMDEYDMAMEMLSGQRQGQPNGQASMGLNAFINDHGVTIRFRDPDGIK